MCLLEKDESHFYKQKANKDGLHGTCKLCMNERTRLWFKNNQRVMTPTRRAKNRLKVKLRKRPYLKYRKDICRRCNFVAERVCQLTVDHIDKDRANNNVNNLQTLCHNCHNLKSYIEAYEPEKLISLNLIPGTSTPS